MALQLHTIFQSGTYSGDLTEFLKDVENAGLRRGVLAQLRPQFEGGKSIAIGYGLDLLIRGSCRCVAWLKSRPGARTSSHCLSCWRARGRARRARLGGS